MYGPLEELEFANISCRIQLTESLAKYHFVRTVGGPGEETEDKCRGVALFLAFDPWETSLKCLPGSARFFDLAESSKLISGDEARHLSQTLIQHGTRMARAYNGAYSPFFSQARVRTIFEHADRLDLLAESALAISGSWADRMFESCPFPLQPSKLLEVQSFRQITMEGEIEFYSQTPWLAWCEALDLICMGTWAGIGPQSITTMVKALEQRVTRVGRPSIQLSKDLLGRKVNLPMFSRGLQGIVAGIFQDVPKDQREPILTTLTQFGETLSDVYADLRWKHFSEALESGMDEDTLAREVINVVSPVNKLIIDLGGCRAGYRILHEHNYWCGYEALRLDELNAPRSRDGFIIAGPNGAEIYIEPLADIPHVNPVFTRMRLENYLNQAFGSIATISTGEALPLRDIQGLLAEYRPYAKDPNASLAKLRQYFVIDKVEKHWSEGKVRVANSEMKRFLEELGRDAKNGYQVTSFASDFDKVFAGRITAAKTRNALYLSWNKGV